MTVLTRIWRRECEAEIGIRLSEFDFIRTETSVWPRVCGLGVYDEQWTPRSRNGPLARKNQKYRDVGRGVQLCESVL